MKVSVVVTVHEGNGDLKSAEFSGKFRGDARDIAIEAGQFTTRVIERAARESDDNSPRLTRITEEEEVDQ